jgi:hypothetical protein
MKKALVAIMVAAFLTVSMAPAFAADGTDKPTTKETKKPTKHHIKKKDKEEAPKEQSNK